MSNPPPTHPLPILLYAHDALRAAEIVSLLHNAHLPATWAGSADIALAALADTPPPMLIHLPQDPRADKAVHTLAHQLQIPILLVLDNLLDTPPILDQLHQSDAWLTAKNLPQELPLRASTLLALQKPPSPPLDSPPTDPQFFSLVIHDLRTPLNVITLSLRMIAQSLPKENLELDQDVRYIDVSLRQIESMLSKLADYYRLFSPESNLHPTSFNPHTLVSETLEKHRAKPAGRLSPIDLKVDPSCPSEVLLDPSKASLAIHYALLNAAEAARGEPISLTLRGAPDRWIIEVTLNQPAPPSVTPFPLTSRDFERLTGAPAERRGMELAIAARITNLFQGAAHLSLSPSRHSTITLNWPSRLPQS